MIQTLFLGALVVGFAFFATAYLRRRFTKSARIGADLVNNLEALNQTNLSLMAEITELKKTKEELAIFKRNFESFLDQTTDFIYFKDINSRIIFCSQTLAKITGHKDWHEMIGKHDREIFPSNTAKIYEEEESAVFSEGIPLLNKIDPYYDAGGKVGYVETNKWPLFDVTGQISGIFGISRDITERKLMEESLRETAGRLSEAQRIAHLGSWELDLVSGRLVWSDEIFRIFEIDPSRFSASYEGFLNAIHPDDRELVDRAYTESLETHTPYEISHRLLMSDGRIKWVMERCTSDFDCNGKALQSKGTVQDITTLKQAEEAATRAQKTAELLAKSKSDFLANMSHEIRTPMNAIIGLSQLALNKQVPDEVRDYLDKINSSSESLLGILNDILDFSKLEAGKFAIEYLPFNLNKVQDTLLNLFSIRAEQKHLTFHIDVDSDVPADLIGDAMRLQQILSNLIGNAIKFTERGEVKLQIECLASDNAQARIRFCVNDTGLGMSQENIDKLFLPFSQADTSITRRFGGTGLGLAISHGLLHLMGGEFSVESQIGKGTRFCFELNLEVAPHGPPQEIDRRHDARKAGALGEELRDQGQKLKGSRILVVEDNRINQTVVKEYLKLSGIEVDIANNGVEALEYLKDKTYDAVLMDVHMPEMGGIEATEIIRKQPQFTNLPIIALTAGVTEEERANCLSCGMNGFVAKPIRPEDLIETLIRWGQKS